MRSDGCCCAGLLHFLASRFILAKKSRMLPTEWPASVVVCVELYRFFCMCIVAVIPVQTGRLPVVFLAFSVLVGVKIGHV